MIELTVKQYLEQKLNKDVYLEIPANPPKEYYFLERTAGGESNYIENATFAIQSRSAESLYNAAEMNEQLKTAMRNIVFETGIMKCKLNTDYNYTDEKKKIYRYQAVYNFTY